MEPGFFWQAGTGASGDYTRWTSNDSLRTESRTFLSASGRVGGNVSEQLGAEVGTDFSLLTDYWDWPVFDLYVALKLRPVRSWNLMVFSERHLTEFGLGAVIGLPFRGEERLSLTAGCGFGGVTENLNWEPRFWETTCYSRASLGVAWTFPLGPVRIGPSVGAICKWYENPLRGTWTAASLGLTAWGHAGR